MEEEEGAAAAIVAPLAVGRSDAVEGAGQRADDAAATAAGAMAAPEDASEGAAPPETKRQKTSSGEAAAAAPSPLVTLPHTAGSDGVGGGGVPYRTVVTSRPVVEARGHTGYLTFARKFV